MRHPRALARRRLDERLARLAAVVGPRPARGWIRAIREVLGMSTTELAARLGVTHARVSQIERAEANDSIRLSTLRRVAAALGCELHYVLVPATGLDEAVRRQARAKAHALVEATTHTMRLEDQEPEADVVAAQIDELADTLIDTRGLWKAS